MITWDMKPHTVGLDRGVLYLRDGRGVPWNGLVSATEEIEPKDEMVKHISEGVRFATHKDTLDLSFELEAFTYPDEMNNILDEELYEVDEELFGISYRVMREEGYEIHIIYNAFVNVTESSWTTGQNIFDPSLFSWEIQTIPIPIKGFKPSSHFVIRTSDAYDRTISELEDVLYGNSDRPPYLPSVDQLVSIFDENSILRIIDHGDGTWTAEGPDKAIRMIDDHTFEIDWPSGIYLNDFTYEISSL